MRSRLFPRLILVVSLLLCATSAYVVSGFSRTTIADVVSGFSRTSSSSNAPHDGAWEAATHVATTSESSFRVRTQQAPLAAYAHSNVVPTVGNARISDLLDVVRDRSPQHSLPLLI